MLDPAEQPTFDADGSPSATVDFDWGAVERACDDDAASLRAENEALREALAEAHERSGEEAARIIGLLAEEPNTNLLGRVTHLLAFLLGVSPFPSQAALARALRIPRSRVTEAKRRIPNKLRPLLRLRNRQIGTSRAKS